MATERAPSAELRDLVRNFKQGYKLERTGGGHYRVRDRDGKLVQTSDGKNLTLSGTARGGDITAMREDLRKALVLRGTDMRVPRQSKKRRQEGLQEAFAKRQANRQVRANELHDRLASVLKNVGGLELPGMQRDLGHVAAMLARQQGRTDITPDLAASSAARVVHRAWVEPRYQVLWDSLSEQLEQADDAIDEWYALVRRAKGLPEDTVVVREPVEGDWPFRVELLPLEALMIDHDYQRPPSWTFVRREAARFDPSLVGTIDVAERRKGAVFAILDGQQRTEIVRLVGKRTIWASIYSGLDKASEARFFLHKNKDRKIVHPYYTFKAQMTGQDPDALAINEIVESHGYKMSISAANEANPERLAAIAAVLQAYKRGTLDITLGTLRASTYGRLQGNNNVLIRGVALFYAQTEGAAQGVMIDVLTREGPELLLGRARDLARSSGGNAEYSLARVLEGEYDRAVKRGRRKAAA